MRRFLVALALAMPLLGRAGYPVMVDFDLPRMIEFVFTEAQWATQNGYSAEQVAQLYETVQQLRQQYAALTGDRGLSGIYSLSTAQRNFLPATWGEMQSPGGAYGAQVNAAASANAILLDAILATMTPQQQAIVRAARQAVGVATTTASTRYDRAAARHGEYQQFISRIGSCDDIKCSSDLNARINAELLMSNNELIQGQAFDQAQRAQQMANDARERESYLQSIGSVKTRTVVTHDITP